MCLIGLTVYYTEWIMTSINIKKFSEAVQILSYTCSEKGEATEQISEFICSSVLFILNSIRQLPCYKNYTKGGVG
jgi:hypothetical protein